MWLIPFRRRPDSFTLQWHLTNACEGNCRHCYDRSDRETLSLDAALRVLEMFQRFCKRRKLKGHISLSGGNPFLYPGFFDLYRAIAAEKITISILGNPVTMGQIEEMVLIRKPVYYQVSLEGLREHNDMMRGKGHYDRTLSFLDDLRSTGIRSHVMLTLTKGNLEQVIPLAGELSDKATRFTFNRLARSGEGSSLDIPAKEDFIRFMGEYIAAGRENPVIGYKDNLFNIFRHKEKRPYFRGCTGMGCGAALTFVALLPDGEVHACRKFPSPIGHILQSDLNDIYDSYMARRYRRPPLKCLFCPVRRICGGCYATVYEEGKDFFNKRDPFCFS